MVRVYRCIKNYLISLFDSSQINCLRSYINKHKLFLCLSGTAKIFNAATHQCLVTLKGHDKEISKVCWGLVDQFVFTLCQYRVT